MPIWMMVGEEKAGQDNVKRVDDYTGHETGRVNHDRKCPHYNGGQRDLSGQRKPECGATWNDPKGYCCGIMGPLFIERSHDGLVLSLGERNGYDDSDFYAVVWNPVEGKTERIEYATTRGWTYPNHAEVDATPEVIAAYEAHKKALADAAKQAKEAMLAKVPSVGKRVTVARGRKVPIGATGEVFWFGRDQYARDYVSRYGYADFRTELDYVNSGLMRVGIRLADGSKVFTNAKNVEIISEGR